MKTIALVSILALAMTGCAGIHRPAPAPKLDADVNNLMTDLLMLPPFPEPDQSSGSTWTGAGPGAALFRDTKAYRLNDMVTIQLDERALGTNGSQTDLSRSSENDYGAEIAMGLEQANPRVGRFSLNNVLRSSSESTFAGDGSTTRSTQLSATITARVIRVLPNGDLIVAGRRSVVVNRENQELTLVGSIRPIDISSSNTVASSRIGDLTVRLWGRGEVDDTTRQGWFVRVLNKIWPF